MDFSIFWDQDTLDRYRINELEQMLGAHARKSRTADRNLVTVIEAMCRENYALRMRLGVLIRLLVERGVISTEEIAQGMEEAKAALAGQVQKPTATPPKPVAVGRKLPKPPKNLPQTPPA